MIENKIVEINDSNIKENRDIVYYFMASKCLEILTSLPGNDKIDEIAKCLSLIISVAAPFAEEKGINIKEKPNVLDVTDVDILGKKEVKH